jgi:hypothetical protein
VPVHDWTRVHACIFHDFLCGWLVDLGRLLNRGNLPPEYYSLLANLAEDVGPDVADLARPGGGLDVADKLFIGDVDITDELKWYARKTKSVTVRLATTHQVVGAIVIVSPGNKAMADELDAFVRKMKELLAVGIHLTVVDLFPAGPHDPSGIHPLIWGGPALENVDLARKRICASYVGGRNREAYIEVATVGERLPNMPLFLAAGRYIQMPLDESYRIAFEHVPDLWREVLEPPPAA